MLNIRSNNIYLTRGDDAPISLALYSQDGKLLPFEELGNIDIIFSMRKKPMKQNIPPLIQKHFELVEVDGMNDPILQFEFKEIDTKFLKYGQYLYDVQYIIHQNGKTITTTVCNGYVELLKEIG